MATRKLILFVVFDLLILLALLLVLVYYGMSHLLLLALGVLFLLMSLYDNRTGQLSAGLALMFNIHGNPDHGGRLNWLPMVLSLILIGYGFYMLMTHGAVNVGQRWTMQEDGVFPQFAIWTALAAVVVILAAVLTTVRSNRKR
jgi:hypothetical protein